MIFCDIDGCIANAQPYVTKYLAGKSDWDEYFKHQSEFEPIPSTVPLLRRYVFAHGDDIIFITGRPESTRADTEQWLRKFIGSNYRYLLMRPKKQEGSTQKMKLDWIRKYQPDLIIDDDPEVVRLALENGFPIIQVHGYRIGKRDNAPGDKVAKRQNYDRLFR